ncbi:MAG: site-specific integrase [Brachymonas sp.]|nr:site-specific integrase [Brachymonas sp.]
MLQETKGTHERTDKITIDESIERFCRWLQRRSPSATTHVHYRSDLRIFFEWAKKPPAQISLQDVDRFIAYAQDEKRYAVATINRKMACLKSFFDYLQVESLALPKNPVHPKRHFLRRAECLPRDVEDATLQKLFEVVTQPRDRAIYLLMLRCGLRLDEVRNLNLSDLYLQPSHGALPRIFVRGKGNKERVAFIAEQTLNALQAWLAVRPVVAEQAVFLKPLAHTLQQHRHSPPPGALLQAGRAVVHLPPVPAHLWATLSRTTRGCADDSAIVGPCAIRDQPTLHPHQRHAGDGRLQHRHERTERAIAPARLVAAAHARSAGPGLVVGDAP